MGVTLTLRGAARLDAVMLNLTSGARRGGVPGSRLQPMTALNAEQGADGPVDEAEQRRLAARARTRSWADEYHYSGW